LQGYFYLKNFKKSIFKELESEKNMGGLLDYRENWGSFFFQEINGNKIETFWPDFVKKNSSACFPLLLSQNFKDFVNFT